MNKLFVSDFHFAKEYVNINMPRKIKLYLSNTKNKIRRQLVVLKLAIMCVKKFNYVNSKIKNVVWYGAYGNSNIGDSLIFFSLYNYVKKYDISVILSTREKEQVTDFGVNTFYRENKKLWRERIKTSDLLLVGGGGLFEYYSHSFNIAESSIITYLEPLVYARFYNKRYGIVGIGANNKPIPNILLRFIFKKVSNDCYSIITRDYKSLEGFTINGTVNKRMTASLDPVFSYCPIKRRMSNNVKTIGFLLWPYYMWPYFHSTCKSNSIYQKMECEKIDLHQRFMSEIDQTVGILKKQGYNVIFPVFHFSDTILLTELGYEAQLISSTDSYFNILQQCDIIVTMRYHGQITSLLNNIPIISIVVQEKMEALIKNFEIEEFSMNIENLSSSDLLKIIEHISCHYFEIKDSLYKKMNFFQKKVYSDYYYFFKYLFL